VSSFNGAINAGDLDRLGELMTEAHRFVDSAEASHSDGSQVFVEHSSGDRSDDGATTGFAASCTLPEAVRFGRREGASDRDRLGGDAGNLGPCRDSCCGAIRVRRS
jgi:hypothetical protein